MKLSTSLVANNGISKRAYSFNIFQHHGPQFRSLISVLRRNFRVYFDVVIRVLACLIKPDTSVA